jgi:hypothetical protein
MSSSSIVEQHDEEDIVSTTTLTPITPARALTRPALADQVGFWSAVLATLGAIAFTIAAVATAIVYPSGEWRGIAAFAADYHPLQTLVTELPVFLLALSFVVLMASIHTITPDDRKILSLIGLAFALMYAAVLGASYYLQLAAVRLSLLHGETDGLTPFILANPHSIVWAWEGYGYGMMCLATLAIAPLFGASRLERWIRALLLVNGAIALSLPLPMLDAPLVLTAVVGGAWAVVFPIATALLAVWFRRREAFGPETEMTRKELSDE